MNKKILSVLLAVPVVFFICWIGYLKISEINAPTYVIAVRGYDPRDLLSGHYLNLRLDWDNTDCEQFGEKRCPVEKFNYLYRFYVPEHDAPILEKILMRQEATAALTFVWPDKRIPRIKDLQINSKPWQESVAEYQQKNKN